MVRPLQDLIGQRFGRLTVVAEKRSKPLRAGTTERIRILQCRCDCGNDKIISARRLRGGTQSCGCLQRERARGGLIHGDTRSGKPTSEYSSWTAMIARCTRQQHPRFNDYGGRGIKVCERWRNSFEHFLMDMGRKPSRQHSIDRHPDNNGNYEPGNCRWATRAEQDANKRPRRTIVKVTARLDTARSVLTAALAWIDKASDGRDGSDYLNGDSSKYAGDGWDDLGALREQIVEALEN